MIDAWQSPEEFTLSEYVGSRQKISAGDGSKEKKLLNAEITEVEAQRAQRRSETSVPQGLRI
jgi:hypothetical protein